MIASRCQLPHSRLRQLLDGQLTEPVAADVTRHLEDCETCRKQLEAMAAGLPLVVTDVGGSQDMVCNGHNGFVVAPGNPREMADFLGQLVRDRAKRIRMAEASRAESARYGWDRISGLYLEAFLARAPDRC